MAEDVEWITVNGAHVPIRKGEDKGQAIRAHFAKKLKEAPEDKETVNEQIGIKKAAAEAEQLSKAVSVLSRAGKSMEEIDNMSKEEILSEYKKFKGSKGLKPDSEEYHAGIGKSFLGLGGMK